MLIKAHNWIGKVGKLLTFSPLHRNISANRNYISKNVDIIQNLEIIYGPLFQKVSFI